MKKCGHIITRWSCYWGGHKAEFHCTKEGWRLYKLLKIHVIISTLSYNSLGKQPTFQQATTGFSANDVWEMRTKIPYWCRPFTTQIWVVGLIGWKFASTNKKTLPDLGIDMSSVWNFCTHFTDIILRSNQWWYVMKCRPFAQATF